MLMTPYVNNLTPFLAMAITHAFYNGHLYDCLFVKGTFRLSHLGRLLPLTMQPAFLINDLYEGKEGMSALARASDIIPFKPGTDFIVTGTAKPAGGLAAAYWLAEIRVGNMVKTVLLTGPHFWKYGVWKGWTLTEIEPTIGVLLSYALAFGGASAVRREKQSDIHWPNPFGRGLFGRDKPNTTAQYAAAQILPVGCGKLKWLSIVESVCLSYVDPLQQARSQFAGTYDKDWRENVAPNIPRNMRMEFWNTVPQDQVAYPYVDGGVEVFTKGLFPTENGLFSFLLPNYRVFAIPIQGDERKSRLPMVIDTVHIDLDSRTVMVRWAALCSRSLGYDAYNVVAFNRDKS